MMPHAEPAAQTAVHYLFGEDRDALFERANCLLAEGDAQALRLRLDVSELHRIEEEQRNASLFGIQPCYALIRNAESATPKQGEHLLKLAQTTQAPHKIILCAAHISWKKAFHKKMRALAMVQQQEFQTPSLHRFYQWLQDEVKHAGLSVDDEGLQRVAEALYGMRLAARQWVERLQLYANGERHTIAFEVMMALLGEHAPDDLNTWVHRVAMRQTSALRLTHRLLYDQQVSEVQMHAWLNTRFQQLLMYRWHHAKRSPRTMQAAKIFGDATRLVPQESEQWQAGELQDALSQLQHTEIQLKGASMEDKRIVLERLVLTLVQP